MHIEISTVDIQRSIDGLRAGDRATIDRLIQLFTENLEAIRQYRFALALDGEHFGNYRSLQGIREEFADLGEEERSRITVHDLIRDVAISSEELWKEDH
jgi:hypothetical protein